MEPVPPFVELAIYGYFLLIAAVGCYVNGRLWLVDRGRDDSGDGLDSN